MKKTGGHLHPSPVIPHNPSPMLLASAAIVAGFALLVWSADRFVIGAAALARNLGISTLVIGLTVVGLGTSAPELTVSAIAAFTGNPGLAIGNAIGSNITNIALVIGITAVVVPLTVASRILRHELPLLVLAMLIALALLLDGELSRVDGLLLLLGLAGTIALFVHDGMHPAPDDPLTGEFEAEIPRGIPTRTALIDIATGLAILLASSRLLVWGAIEVAHGLGVSDLVIGLTVVAIGTSLPELAACVMSARRGEHDIAIGNVIGSNLFNVMGVLGLAGLIAPTGLPAGVLARDYPMMLILTGLLFLMAYGLHRARRITRLEGVLLLAAYCGYLFWLFGGLAG